MKLLNLGLCMAAAFALASCGAVDAPKLQSAAQVQDVKKVFQDEEVSAGLLSGAFINAGEYAPIVVIVPGSGPTDRDGNNQGFKSNALKLLAYELAENGISSIRVDKRGLFTSAGAGNGNAVTVASYGEDYRQWAKTAIDVSGRDCAFLLGHSEGGLMVSAAALGQDNICGVITLAAPGRRASDILREQLNSNPANKIVLKSAESVIVKLENGERADVSKLHPALQGLFYPDVQDFLISMFAVDPAQILAAVEAPALVIQGEHDIQVQTQDAQRLSGASGAELVLVPSMNHVLKTAPKGHAGNLKLYNSPDTPIDSLVTDAAARFIHKHK